MITQDEHRGERCTRKRAFAATPTTSKQESPAAFMVRWKNRVTGVSVTTENSKRQKQQDDAYAGSVVQKLRPGLKPKKRLKMITQDERKKIEAFFKEVLAVRGITGWQMDWYPDETSEAYCWRSRKTINIGPNWPAYEDVARLLVHEIAHIDTCLSLKDQHSQPWQDLFASYCLKYGFDPMDDDVYAFQMSPPAQEGV